MAQLPPIPTAFHPTPEERELHSRTQQLPPSLPTGGATRPPQRAQLYDPELASSITRTAQQVTQQLSQQFFDTPLAADAPAPITGMPWSSTPAQTQAYVQRVQYDPNNDTFPADCELNEEHKHILGLQSQFVGFMDTPAKVIEHWKLVRKQQAAAEAADAELAKSDREAQREAKRAADAQRTAFMEAARQEWKKAVEARRVAVLQWDEYVRSRHNAYTAARNA